jgi:hypothetical protein
MRDLPGCRIANKTKAPLSLSAEGAGRVQRMLGCQAFAKRPNLAAGTDYLDDNFISIHAPIWSFAFLLPVVRQ